eukprot:m.357122 g.357122  ORF g.357122 m.357122 type:complete len:610 (-) comp17718_c0_seq1:256-2085(-)
MASELELKTTIGFGGAVQDGLHVHPGKEHLIYPLGCTVVVERIAGKRQQQFLQGHTDEVSCIAVSKSGAYIASGQVTHQGYPATIIIWDFKTLTKIHEVSLHQVKVAALSFSCDDRFLVSLGGQDDGTLAVWDVVEGRAIAGAATADTSGGHAEAISFVNNDPFTFVSGGKYTIRVWEINPRTFTLTPTNCALRSLRRIVKCIAISADDSLAYCGTSTGDIVCVSIPHKVLKSTGPHKKNMSLGVASLCMLPDGNLVIGAGDGTFATCNTANFRIMQSATVVGAITSIALRGDSELFIATNDSDVYKVNAKDLTKFEPRVQCHPYGISDIQFPRGTNELFATSSHNNINVWHTPTGKALLHIKVPGAVCNGFGFMADGKLIVSGWDDGVIRAFLPQSGKLKWKIEHAHNKGVTAIALSNDCTRVVSGGGDGQVRVWRLGPSTQQLQETLKEHKARITDIRLRADDSECVTASEDGSCIVWDLNRFVRSQIMFASCKFAQVRFRPDEAQLLSCGSDRKVHYWEAFDGSLIRELEMSASGALLALDISPDGSVFVTGGQDKLLKVVTYDEGEVLAVGTGHGGDITRAAICPNQQYVISVTANGSIFIFNFP